MCAFFIIIRWNLANEGIGEQLQKAQASLRLWESYVSLHAEATEKLDHHEEQCSSLWADNTPTGRTVDSLKQKAQEVKVSGRCCSLGLGGMLLLLLAVPGINMLLKLPFPPFLCPSLSLSLSLVSHTFHSPILSFHSLHLPPSLVVHTLHSPIPSLFSLPHLLAPFPWLPTPARCVRYGKHSQGYYSFIYLSYFCPAFQSKNR